MPVLLLVRHGQASFGAEDYDQLSPTGRDQSVRTGEHLRTLGLRRPVVVHGTLRRQRDTAALAWPGAEPRIDPRWDEYDHLDLLKRYVRPQEPAPTSSRELQGLLDAALTAWVEHGDDGGWPAFSGGAVTAAHELAGSLDRGQDALVFTSGGVVAAVCAALLGLGAPGVVALNRVAVNGGITKLVAGSSGTSLVSFNEHGHLAGSDVTYR